MPLPSEHSCIQNLPRHSNLILKKFLLSRQPKQARVWHKAVQPSYQRDHVAKLTASSARLILSQVDDR